MNSSTEHIKITMCITLTLAESVNLDDLDLFGGFCVAYRLGTSHKYFKDVLGVLNGNKSVKGMNNVNSANRKRWKPALEYINNMVKTKESKSHRLTDPLPENVMTFLLSNLSRCKKLKLQGKCFFEEVIHDDGNLRFTTTYQKRVKTYLKELGAIESQLELYFLTSNGRVVKIEKRVKSYPRMEGKLRDIVEMKKALTNLPPDDDEVKFFYEVHVCECKRNEEDDEDSGDEDDDEKYNSFARQVIETVAEEVGEDDDDVRLIRTQRDVHPLFWMLAQVTGFIDHEGLPPTNIEYYTLTLNLMLISAKEKEEWALCNNIACSRNYVKLPVFADIDMSKTFYCHYIGSNCRIDHRFEMISHSLMNSYLNKEKEAVADTSESTKKRKRGKDKNDKDDSLKKTCAADLHLLDMFPSEDVELKFKHDTNPRGSAYCPFCYNHIFPNDEVNKLPRYQRQFVAPMKKVEYFDTLMTRNVMQYHSGHAKAHDKLAHPLSSSRSASSVPGCSYFVGYPLKSRTIKANDGSDISDIWTILGHGLKTHIAVWGFMKKRHIKTRSGVLSYVHSLLKAMKIGSDPGKKVNIVHSEKTLKRLKSLKAIGSKISSADLVKLLEWELDFLLQRLITDIQRPLFLEYLEGVTASSFLNDFNAMFYCCPTEAVILPSVYHTVRHHMFFWNDDVRLRNDAEESEESDSEDDQVSTQPEGPEVELGQSGGPEGELGQGGNVQL